MNEEEARELAFAMLMDFEEVLEEYDVTIPSADREGTPEEARLYGTEYYDLEDAITEVLKKNNSRRIGLRDARRLSFLILEEIEEALREAGCSLPPGLRQGPYGYPRVGEQEWDRLRAMIIGVLTRWGHRPERGKRGWSGPDDEARAAVEQMRQRMAEAPAGIARRG